MVSLSVALRLGSCWCCKCWWWCCCLYCFHFPPMVISNFIVAGCLQPQDWAIVADDVGRGEAAGAALAEHVEPGPQQGALAVFEILGILWKNSANPPLVGLRSLVLKPTQSHSRDCVVKFPNALASGHPDMCQLGNPPRQRWNLSIPSVLAGV